jgi:hypothetical protein
MTDVTSKSLSGSIASQVIAKATPANNTKHKLSPQLPFLFSKEIYLTPCRQKIILWSGVPMASSVLIGILITFLVIVLILYLVARLPIDGRAKQIVQIIVIIIGIISLLKYLAVF